MKKYVIKATIRFEKWLLKLKDNVAKVAIARRINRIKDGNLGDCKAVGIGVFEARVHVGPGYRVYFAYQGEEVIVLLCAGDKSSQSRDIETAERELEEIKNEQT
ncbi:MAG: addiction module killer protein [Hyphomonadaceae bacterium]|nr:MAG: addiction module killer protein [Hyphomonadaceae bacterium]KAF0184351.1 MAG: addiction module killer protein [Hyphomonadaceae bacterium]